MDKMPGEEDFKGLEEEIDDAVDRLFVENKRGGRKTLPTESPHLETSLSPLTPELSTRSQTLEPSPKPPDLEPFMEPPSLKSSMKSTLEEPSMESTISQPSMKLPVLEPSMKTSLLEPSHEFESDKTLGRDHSPHPPSPSVSLPKSIENMEAQLLSLEWEITQEKLGKTREEVLALREAMKQKAETTSLLSYMEEVLSHMIKNEENIRPPWIKFLLDCKETLKLLMRKETEAEINTYKQLAHLGIEARYACLEGLKKDTKILMPSPGRGVGTEKSKGPIPSEKGTTDMTIGEKKIEDMSIKMSLFMEKAEEIFRTLRQQAAKIEEITRKSPTPSAGPKPGPVSVTIFRVNKRLFGVESEKVFKLFKVSTTFLEKYPGQQKIRLKDFEVKTVDLKKLFSISGGERPGETRILIVKDNEEYKGLLVDEVLNKSSTLLEKREELGEYCSGVIHSTYQERPMEIPVLDLKKL